MAKPLPPIPLSPSKPGVSKSASPLSLSDRWIDSDKVLFIDGKPEKYPGWTKKTLTSVIDPIRGILAWSTIVLSSFIAFGTHRKLYVVDTENAPNDITPIESSGSLTNPFTTTTSSSTVTVAHTAHGRHFGDAVIFSGATAVGGITPNGAYTVSSVADDNTYTIEHSAAATSGATGGGTVAYQYEIPIGASDPVEGDGYGAGSYGLGDYGAPTEEAGISVIFEPRVWSLANGGDLLYANPVNAGIYVFDPNDTPAYQRAEALANAPTVCRTIFITPERFLFALGVNNDPMNIAWPDQDDFTNWTPGATTTANTRRLREGTHIVGGAGIANFISGIWTDTALYRFQYTGNSFIYDSTLAGTNCGLVSPMAVIVRLGVAFWMSRNAFLYWAGSGAPQPIPNSDDVREFVIRALRDTGFEFKCNAYYSSRYNCIMWLYVADSDTEPGFYALVSLADFSWAVGTLERTSGTTGFDQRPILAAADGYLYQHEDGSDADGAAMNSFVTRAPLQIAEGTVLGEIQGVVPDLQRQTGDLTVEITTYDRLAPDGSSVPLDSETITFSESDSQVDPSIGGRIASFTIRSNELGGDFRIGSPMLEVKSTGRQR